VENGYEERNLEQGEKGLQQRKPFLRRLSRKRGTGTQAIRTRLGKMWTDEKSFGRRWALQAAHVIREPELGESRSVPERGDGSLTGWRPSSFKKTEGTK